MDAAAWTLKRTPDQIRVDRDACRVWVQEATAEQAPYREYAFAEGAIAVYDWVLGVKPEPLWSRLEPATPEALLRTDNGAHDAIMRLSHAPEVISLEWAQGVHHAAIWARGATSDAPGGTSEDEEEF